MKVADALFVSTAEYELEGPIAMNDILKRA